MHFVDSSLKVYLNGNENGEVEIKEEDLERFFKEFTRHQGMGVLLDET